MNWAITRLFGEACPCGRNLPVITKVLGRTRNRLILPDGRSEFPYLGEHGQTERLTGVRVQAFQFVQHSVQEIEVKYVTDRAFTPEETDKVIRMFQNNLGHPFQYSPHSLRRDYRGCQGQV